eukprot:CAMPEP_0115079950 /NCGR_PEP_ID=MMETSP0227-20121206/18397_1 /TAXON_ID=89957 /ORGANISM="Polarella glacialis, Strain CCMP 1383" /LENGTH=232 /DNA_ID=CAMNT_0002467519 /DNA_START=52 /DNA_END=750 /DNA_ORIENTATION=+
MAAEQPKKAKSAYFLFLEANRESFWKFLGSKLAGPFAKHAGAQWKVIAPAEKEKLVSKAAELKKEADKKIAAFKAQGGVITRKRKGGAGKEKKAKKDKNAPKKPAGGAYGCFLAKNRESIKATLPANHKITDVTKAASVQWKVLTAAQKTPYDDDYKTKAEEYKKAKAAYVPPAAAAEDEEEEEDEEEAEEGAEEEAEEKSAASPKAKARGKAKAKSSPKAKGKAKAKARGK